MGTDIHYIFETKDETGKWQEIAIDYDNTERFYIGRSYLLFSVLAGVRNGHGFAGVPTYKPVEVIAEPRGLPDNVSSSTEENTNMWHHDDDDGDPRFGDHSYSYLTGDEILEHFRVVRHTTNVGIITKEAYFEWSGDCSPDMWYGGISGPDVSVFDSQGIRDVKIPDGYTHIKVMWDVNINDVLTRYVEMFKLLKDMFGEYRMVFGFDS